MFCRIFLTHNLFFMKKSIVLLLVLLLNVLSLVAQNEKKNTVYMVTTPNAVIYTTRSSIDGGGSYNGKMGIVVGVEYGRELFKNFEVLSGVHYSHNRISAKTSSSLGPDVPVTKHSFNRNFVAIPILVKYHFTDMFFVNGGTILNMSKGEKYSSKKDKLESTINGDFGLYVGLGAKFDFQENYCLTVNPYFQTNDLSSQRHVNFFNVGVKIGVGYKF